MDSDRPLLLQPRFTLATAAAAAFVLGALYVVAPQTPLSSVGLDHPTDPWIRVLGALAIAIGVLHAAGAIANQRWYYRASIVERVAAGSIQIALSQTIGLWQLAMFGSLDLISAAWTSVALRDATTTLAPSCGNIAPIPDSPGTDPAPERRIGGTDNAES